MSRKPKLVVRPRPARIPASHAQQRLWVIDRLRGGSREYHMQERLDIRGPLDPHVLTRAVNALVARHEMLRTHFVEIDGAPTQVIEPERCLALRVEDLRGAGDDRRLVRLHAAAHEELAEAFDLTRGPLLRLRLLQIADEEHVLIRTAHHIACDGLSQRVFTRELFELYAAFQAGRPDPLPPLAVQYADFTTWHADWLDEARIRDGLAYWTTQLARAPQALTLPTDRDRPATPSLLAGIHHVVLPESTTTALENLRRSSQTTPYMTMLAVFVAVLARYTGQHDIVVGSPVANRPDQQLEGLIGFFVNMLALRTRIEPATSFRDLLMGVRRTLLDAYRHQHVPFERVVEALGVRGPRPATPVFQVLFTQRAPRSAPDVPGLQVSLPPDETRPSRFDLDVHAGMRDGRFELTWIYDRDLFDAWRIEQMAAHYVRFAEAVAANPEVAIVDVPLLRPQERQRLLDGWTESSATAALAS